MWDVIEFPNAFKYEMTSVCQHLCFQDPLMTVLIYYLLTRFLMSEDNWMTSLGKALLYIKIEECVCGGDSILDTRNGLKCAPNAAAHKSLPGRDPEVMSHFAMTWLFYTFFYRGEGG